MAASKSPVALIMAGGSGTRFWPASLPSLPKQFLPLMGERSLIQDTVDRIAPLVAPEHTFICSAESQVALLQKHLPDLARRQNFFLEPQGKNTAACLMLSLSELYRRGYAPDTIMFALPADHFIRDAVGFREILQTAAKAASEKKALVTLGIVPTSPHTGYGYIETQASASGPTPIPVTRFVEKPDRARAEDFLRRKNFFWNAGIFIWSLATLEEAFKAHMPQAWAKISQARGKEQLAREYENLESIPIDVGVLEKASPLLAIPANIGWSDIGSWDALYQLKAPTPHANAVLSGDVREVESRGCLVNVPPGKKVALVGVEDLIIVQTNDTLLIAKREQDQKVREVAKQFTRES